MEQLPQGQITFKVHGPDSSNDEVAAEVFATKLSNLVKALKAADRAVNGKVLNEIVIVKLNTSTPTAILAERPIQPGHESNDAIEAFDDCVQAVIAGDVEKASKFGQCAKFVGRLSSGSKKKFGYAEVWTGKDNIIRIDNFLAERSRDVVRAVERDEKVIAEKKSWFKGRAHGSFEGSLMEVDLRGSLPEIKLILSGGNKQIDCVCRGDQIDEIKEGLNGRVRIYGDAIYDGKTGLPRRIVVAEIVPLKKNADLTKWKGMLTGIEQDSWDDDP